MKIVIDIQSAVTQRAGVGRYTRELLEHLPRVMNPDDCLTGFFFDFKGKAQPSVASSVALRRCGWCPGRIAEQVWKRVNWPPYDWFSGPADIFHFPNFTARPITSGHAVITVHDVSFIRYPQFTEARNLAFLSARLPESVRCAEVIITDSKFSAAEIVDTLQVPSERVVPIPLGISPQFSRPQPEALTAFRKKYNLFKPYILTVGTLEPRKNLPFLISCFEQLEDFDGELILAGTKGWLYEPIIDRIKQSSCHDRIRMLEGLPDAAIPSLYAAAELFVCASFYEGFGFPPLEAMACGTPVLSSNGGALRETLGQAACVMEDFDLEHWLNQFRRVLSDSNLRTDMIERGSAHAAGFRWEETARQTWQIYRRLTRKG